MLSLLIAALLVVEPTPTPEILWTDTAELEPNSGDTIDLIRRTGLSPIVCVECGEMPVWKTSRLVHCPVGGSPWHGADLRDALEAWNTAQIAAYEERTARTPTPISELPQGAGLKLCTTPAPFTSWQEMVLGACLCLALLSMAALFFTIAVKEWIGGDDERAV